jgi:uncharacterized protein (UPF0333 family)
MNDAASLLITTTCLAVVGMGIYLFSSDSSDETSSTKQTQKGGKKASYASDNRNHHNDNNNNDDQNIYENKEIISEPEQELEPLYEPENKPKQKVRVSNNKTKKNNNKISFSRKKYYY